MKITKKITAWTFLPGRGSRPATPAEVRAVLPRTSEIEYLGLEFYRVTVAASHRLYTNQTQQVRKGDVTLTVVW